MLSSSYLTSFLLLTLTGYLYDKYKSKIEKNEKLVHDDIVKQFLFNDTVLDKSKPIIWVHVSNEINARNWKSFGSRNNTDINQPYKYLTIKSIVNNGKNDFNICIINDYSFSKLLPKWSIDLKNLADPVKSKIRNLAICNLLYVYGGLLIPSSYLSLDNISNIYNIGMHNSSCFVVEGSNKSVSSKYFDIYPSHLFMGCKKKCPVMKELINYLEVLCSRDHTYESYFLGDINNKCNTLVSEGKMELINGKMIGIINKYNKPIIVEDLLGSLDIDYDENLQGILIPDTDILSRSKYQWFSRLSIKQVYEANTVISKYMRTIK